MRDALIAEAKEIGADQSDPPEDPTKPSDAPPYVWLNGKDRAALCLSGGGIRSAAFGLGVLQALAHHPRPPVEDRSDPPSVAKAEESLLRRIDYLSTVSGGGYIGSWLSAWIRRAGFDKAWSDLTGRPDGADSEPASIGRLRHNSNYLTLKLGVLSADSWTAVALYLRNLLLNWLIILPAFCGVLLALKWFAVLAASFWRDDLGLGNWIVLAWPLGAACMIVALGFVNASRPTYGAIETGQIPFLYRVMLPIVLSAVLFSALFLSPACQLLLTATSHCGACTADRLAELATTIKLKVLLAATVSGMIIYGLGWIVAGWFRRGMERRSVRDGISFMLAGAVYGALAGLGLWLLQSYATGPYRLYAVLGLCLPWLLMAQLTAEAIFVGITHYQRNSDSDREWLGRAAGWYTSTALIWLAVVVLAYFGSAVLASQMSEADHPWMQRVQTWLAPVGGISGIVTGLLGRSSITSRKGGNGEVRTWGQIISDAILAIAAPIFGAMLIIGLSYTLDLAFLGKSFFGSKLLTNPGGFSAASRSDLIWLIIATVIMTAVAGIASWQININRFSLHSLYRNRLIREFLGATNQDRHGDPFTNFDNGDNLPMQELRADRSDAVKRDGRPFHVLNLALNIVSTKNLAWQERKATSFTVSPLHAGTVRNGYRDSALYAGAPGITLGTAMAISGAAASPNMGYHSSPTITLTMALLNVRLGWWLGNTGGEGERSFQMEGPGFALKWFFLEAFGLTTDERSFVYLSDGGHFENLGLYEMVRRRCRHIIISDAGCDPDFEFEDLGNAVRKIEIDLGVRITLDNLETLKPRSADGAAMPQAPYHCIGTVHYAAADGGGSDGRILYIKPGYHGTESAGIRAYALAHPAYPHEPTSDQWFGESQFESYRKLGFEITDGILSQAAKRAARKVGPGVAPDLRQIFDAL